MKALVFTLTLTVALAWGTVASAQFGQGVPGGYFGSGGLYGGGSPQGIPNSSPSFGGMPSGQGSSPLFQGFTYSPYNYSSPSYGRLTPTFGTPSRLGFTVPTYEVPIDTSPIYGARRLSPTGATPYFGDRSYSSYRYLSRSGRFRSQNYVANFYSTGFGFSPTWRTYGYVRPW